jgi:hypothetical protein
MKPGDIIFVQGKSVLSRLIRYFDKGKFSHVAVAISPTEVLEADIFIKSKIRPFNKDDYSLIEVIDLGLTEEQRRMMPDIAKEYVGLDYDYPQIFWYAIRRIFGFKGKNPLNNPNNLICSELVFHVLDRLGILSELGIDGDYRGIDLTPNELYDLVKYISSQ